MEILVGHGTRTVGKASPRTQRASPIPPSSTNPHLLVFECAAAVKRSGDYHTPWHSFSSSASNGGTARWPERSPILSAAGFFLATFLLEDSSGPLCRLGLPDPSIRSPPLADTNDSNVPDVEDWRRARFSTSAHEFPSLQTVSSMQRNLSLA